MGGRPGPDGFFSRPPRRGASTETLEEGAADPKAARPPGRPGPGRPGSGEARRAAGPGVGGSSTFRSHTGQMGKSEVHAVLHSRHLFDGFYPPGGIPAKRTPCPRQSLPREDIHKAAAMSLDILLGLKAGRGAASSGRSGLLKKFTHNIPAPSASFPLGIPRWPRWRIHEHPYASGRPFVDVLLVEGSSRSRTRRTRVPDSELLSSSRLQATRWTACGTGAPALAIRFPAPSRADSVKRFQDESRTPSPPSEPLKESPRGSPVCISL